VFLLAGGPRDGDLVDALPADYQLLGAPRPEEVPIGEDFVAYRAVWVWSDEQSMRAWLTESG
jgi:hypothetical protein